MLPDFKTYYKLIIKTVALAKRETSMLMDRLMSPEIDLYRQIDAKINMCMYMCVCMYDFQQRYKDSFMEK